MSHIRLAILVLGLVFPSAARAADGGIQLYFQPLPADAERLTFTVGSLTAIASTGSEHAISLNLKTIAFKDAARQRLLASGRLPEGSYTGFSLAIKQAALKRGQNEVALALPDQPMRVDVPFVVSRRQPSVVWLALTRPHPSAGGVEFSPGFSAVIPARPIADNAGFVANTGSNSITVFDKTLAQAVAAIETCAEPRGLAIDPPRRRLYVACSRDDEIQAFDVSSGALVERAPLSPGDRPGELALTPDGRTLLSANGGSNSVGVFDALSLTLRDRLSVGNAPASISIDPAGRRAFVFNTFSSSLSVIDLASRRLAGSVTIDAAPLRGQFSRRGDRLYIVHERSPYMTVLDPERLSSVTRARLRTGVDAIAVDRVRDLVCLGSENDTSIEFYDPRALMPLYSVRIRAGASHLAIDGDTSRLYAVSADTSSLIVVDLANRKVVSEIDLGRDPSRVAVMGGR